MTKDEIKEKWFDVSILNKGIDGDTLCYKVHNNLLGEFVIDNCHYQTDTRYNPDSATFINGSCTLSLDEGECIFITELTINSENSNKGVVFFRC